MSPPAASAAARHPSLRPRVALGDLVTAGLPWVVSLLLLWWVLTAHDLDALATVLAGADLGRFVSALACFLAAGLFLDAAFFFLSFRWVEGVGRFGEMLRARAASELLMLVTLFAGLGGLVVYGRKRYGVSISRGTGLALLDLLHEAAAIGTLAVAGLAVAWPGLSEGMRAELEPVGQVGLVALGFYGLCVACSIGWKRLPGWMQFASPLEVFREISLAQFGVFWAIKVVKNLAMGCFVAVGISCFGVQLPAVVGVALTQVVLLLRGLPVTAFGIGVDQLSIPLLFAPFSEGNGTELVGFSATFTFALLAGRALLGVPMLRGVLADLKDS